MRQISHRPLWIGHVGDLCDARAIMDAGIEAIIELADNEPFAGLPRELVRFRFPLSDGGDNPAWLLRLAVESVATLLRVGIPTLVCCSAGMSRSVCISAGGIANHEKRPFRDVLIEVTDSGPADVSPRLFGQIQQVMSGSQIEPHAPDRIPSTHSSSQPNN